MIKGPHPFDRYAPFTDVALLKEFSSKPLRKSMRVNTLKSSVEDFQRWAMEKKWKLQPVPWCSEAFFVDRDDRSEALGKDLLHLFGHAYMQEAASMLPVELLVSKPGDTVLDMSAAPGSKTTQIAAKLQGRGVIIANDVQEKRLWTLKSSIHRAGAINVIVTRKVGQWFGKHMTERFDCVLCDAPCTAQGTARKDSDALEYCSIENIGKMAKLQRELLESAIHAAKVGGRVVYSTCTLTPEENEETIFSMLQKFPNQLEVVDPRAQDFGAQASDFGKAIEDSFRVQETLRGPGCEVRVPLIRLWPQTYDTEGFFCAVLRKKASTLRRELYDAERSQEDEVPKAKSQKLAEAFEKHYGSSFLLEGDRLYQRGEQLLLATQEIAEFRMPVQDYALGLPFALRLEDDRLRLSHETATLRGRSATKNTCDLSQSQMHDLLDGKDTTCPVGLTGDALLLYKGMPVGVGLARDGKLKNRLPRWVVQKS